MKKIIQYWTDRLFGRIKPLAAGVYTHQSPPEVQPASRMHLRIDPGGTGVLILNASTVLHLNQTATEYAYHLVQRTDLAEMATRMAARYRVSRDQALADYNTLSAQIQALIETPDLDPETFLGMERIEPYGGEITAPYRLDCALTYRVSGDIVSGDSSTAPQERVKRDLLTQEWQLILQKAWQAGIPHIIFTGGEPTLRPDLPELISFAERQGQVTGLLTDGLRLAETDYLHQLLEAGLDHLMIVLQEDEQCWEAIRDVQAEDIYTTVHVTITPATVSKFTGILNRLAELEVTSISLSVSDPSLAPALKDAAQAAAEHGFKLVWNLPTPYSALNPVALELAAAGERAAGAGRAWLYVEPDGDVLPGQGILTVMGNLLTESWETIKKAIRPE
jgi:organic radical activating enzyme